MISVVLVGNVGKDPQTRQAGSSSVTSFSVAINRKERGEEKADWYTVEAWGKLGERVAQQVVAGKSVSVRGSQALQTYEKNGEKRTNVVVTADDVRLVGPKPAAAAMPWD